MPLQGYIDDSKGGKGQRRMFVFAGFVNEAEWWAIFSNKWEQWLNVPPSIPVGKKKRVLKMDKLENLGWSTEDINRKLRGFLKIIKTPPLPSITYISLDLDKFKTWKHCLISPLDQEVYIPALSILASVAHEQIARGKQEQCEVFFDEMKMFKEPLQLLYPSIRNSLIARNRALSVLPNMPRFEDDEDFLPLQAAEILAWVVRHAESREHHDYEWLAMELNELPRCEYHGEVRELAPMNDEDKQNMVAPEVFAVFERNMNLAGRVGRRIIRNIKPNYEKNRPKS